MNYAVPTNWDDRLIETIVSLKRGNRVEIYGKLHEDYFGGGRVSVAVPLVSTAKAERHIALIHSKGLEFNYLLNTSCLENLEYTRGGQRRIERMLGWLDGMGVESVTVSIPYLLELIKKRYPRFRVYVSTMAHVNSLLKAVRWAEMGADKITLSSTESNRDFRLFRLLKERVSCPIQLVANVNCLYNCPYHFYHANISSHASQKGRGTRGFVIDYCFLSCRLRHFTRPEEFIRSCWIRPEDTAWYEQAGITSLKLIDRGMSTLALTRVFTAYMERRYDGNLMDLFRTPSKASRDTANSFFSFSRFFRPFSANLFKLARGRSLVSDADVRIDNRQLDGFIEHFLTHSCADTSCESCGHCAAFARKAVTADTRQTAAQYASYKGELVSGALFRYSRPKESGG